MPFDQADQAVGGWGGTQALMAGLIANTILWTTFDSNPEWFLPIRLMV